MTIKEKLTNYIDKINEAGIVVKTRQIMSDIEKRLRYKKYKKLYPDYENDDFNIDHLKFIWGVKTYNYSSKPASFQTINDIQIIYDRKNEIYSLSVGNIWILKAENEYRYLKGILKEFTKFMNDNNYSTNYVKHLPAIYHTNILTAETIEELYINFKIFVEGYCNVYGSEKRALKLINKLN